MIHPMKKSPEKRLQITLVVPSISSTKLPGHESNGAAAGAAPWPFKHVVDEAAAAALHSL
jgi:hypothetical protein